MASVGLLNCIRNIQRFVFPNAPTFSSTLEICQPDAPYLYAVVYSPSLYIQPRGAKNVAASRAGSIKHKQKQNPDLRKQLTRWGRAWMPRRRLIATPQGSFFPPRTKHQATVGDGARSTKTRSERTEAFHPCHPSPAVCIVRTMMRQRCCIVYWWAWSVEHGMLCCVARILLLFVPSWNEKYMQPAIVSINQHTTDASRNSESERNTLHEP